MKFLLVLALLAPTLAFAESQTGATDGGILDLRIAYDDIAPETDQIILIEFVNPTTEKVQVHIDYDIRMTLDGAEILATPLIHSSEGIVRGLKAPFPSAGEYVLDIGVEGILFQPISRETASFVIPVGVASAQTGEPGGGCLVATAAYGTETAPQIQRLREIRDQHVLSTDAGSSFIAAFNGIYYAFSPAVADMERENPLIKGAVLVAIQPILASLHIMEHADTESEVIVYGMLVILLNVAMYIAGPVLAVLWLPKAAARRGGSRESLRRTAQAGRLAGRRAGVAGRAPALD